LLFIRSAGSQIGSLWKPMVWSCSLGQISDNKLATRDDNC